MRENGKEKETHRQGIPGERQKMEKYEPRLKEKEEERGGYRRPN